MSSIHKKNNLATIAKPIFYGLMALHLVIASSLASSNHALAQTMEITQTTQTRQLTQTAQSMNGDGMGDGMVAPTAKPVRVNFTPPTILPLQPSNILPAKTLPATAPAPIDKPKVASKDAKNTAPALSDDDISDLFQDEEAAAIPDPGEDTNRQLLDFNIFLDRAFLKPIATTVGVILPTPVAQILRNILENLQEPSKFVYLALSGHLSDSLLTLSRFTINSTLGVGGAFDPASSMTDALRTKDTSADLMLASWGVPIGNYNVAFFAGPSSQRAGFASYADNFFNPAGIALSLLFPRNDIIIRSSILGGKTVLSRPAVLDTIADFSDPYAVARSAYWQNYLERQKNYINKNKK